MKVTCIGRGAKVAFTQIPNDALMDPSLSDAAFRLLIYALYLSEGRQRVTRERLCTGLSRSLSTVKRGLAELRELGYAHVEAPTDEHPYSRLVFANYPKFLGGEK